MKIQSKEIRRIDCEELISILNKSKNLLRFHQDHVEMQVFDSDGNEHFSKIDYSNLNKLVTTTRWRAQKNTENYIAIVATTPGGTIIQSREILGLNKLDEKFVDHIDGDPTNNTVKNLRKVTHAENMMNRRSLVSGRLWKGIYFSKQRKKWIAQITINGKSKNLGGYTTDKQAAIEYNKHAIIHFGQFAKLNVV